MEQVHQVGGEPTNGAATGANQLQRLNQVQLQDGQHRLLQSSQLLSLQVQHHEHALMKWEVT
jgi:hypothetical protein